jgi:hypothetical protein
MKLQNFSKFPLNTGTYTDDCSSHFFWLSLLVVGCAERSLCSLGALAVSSSAPLGLHRTMSIRGVRQLTNLTLRYCDLGGICL